MRARECFCAGAIRCLVGGMLAASPLACAAAEQPPVPDEFAVTESISLTDRDEFYLSPSIRYSKLPDQKAFTADADLAYGFTDRFQIETDVPYESINPDSGSSANGIGDVGVAARYGVVDYRQSPFALDVGLGLTSPTGDHRKDLGDGRVVLGPSFTASQWLGRVNVELNFAWQRALGNGGTDPQDEYVYNAAVAYPIHHCFLVLEGNGDTASRSTKYSLTPELVWKVTEHFELRVAAPIGVTRAAGDYAIIGGFTIEFDHLFHRPADQN